MKPYIRISLLLLTLLWGSGSADAQFPTIARGFEADRAYQIGDVDSVNVFNGNLIGTIPLGQEYSGGGILKYRIGLIYNSKSWDFELRPYLGNEPGYPNEIFTKAVPTKRSNAGMGWLVSLGRLIPPEDPINTARVENTTAPWVYESPDGAEHEFSATLHSGETVDTNFMYTRDGSYIRMKTVSSTVREVHLPDGIVYSFIKGGNSYWLTEIRDPFQLLGTYLNRLSVTYHDAAGAALLPANNATAASWKLSEYSNGTVVRTHYVRFAARYPLNAPSNYNRQVSEVELATFGWTSSKYLFSYVDTQIEYSCSGDYRGTQTGGTPPPTVPLLASVSIPDGVAGAAGSSWSFTHRVTNQDLSGSPLSTGCGSGMLKSMTLPTRGKIDYTYRPYNLPTVRCITGMTQGFPVDKVHSFTVGIATRRSYDPAGGPIEEWTYSQSTANSTFSHSCGSGSRLIPAEAITTVVAPDGTTTKSYFSIWPRDENAQGDYRPRDFGLPYSRTKNAAGTAGCSPTVATSLCRSKEVFQCATCSTPETTTYVRFVGDSSSSIYLGSQFPQRRLEETRTVYNTDGNKWVNTKYSDFDGLGNYRQTQITSSGFTPVANQTSYTRYLISKATTTTPYYALSYPSFNIDPVTWTPTTTFTGPAGADPWILNKWDESWSSNGTRAEKVEAWHDPATGFMTRQRTLRNTAASAASITRSDKDLITIRTKDYYGNVASEEYFGGDGNAVAYNVPIRDLALPTHNSSTYRIDHSYVSGSLASSAFINVPGSTPMGFFSVNRTIDSNTGLPSRTYDGRSTSGAGGIPTDFIYDRLGRLQWSKPVYDPVSFPAGNDAWTEFVYTRATSSTAPAKVNIYSRPNGSTTGVLAQAEYQYDASGRLWRERRLMENGTWATKETLYSNGKVSSVSEWDTVLAPAKKTTYLYDWAGRVTTMTPPDGAAHAVTTTYTTGGRLTSRTVKVATAVGSETPATTTEEYDALGRLYTVTEPNGTKTRYTYDNAGRLTQVCGGFTTGCVQTRTFTFDGAGLMSSEVHPELTTWYSGFDARGQAASRRQGPAGGSTDITTVLDRAGRVTSIKETGSNLPLKVFTYGTSNTTNDLALGKLKTALRHNRTKFDIDARVTETYTYGGRGGRASSRSTAIDEFNLSGSPVAHKQFEQAWTWNDLGQQLTSVYPSCQAGTDCASTPPPVLTLTHVYTNGWLTSVRNHSSYNYGLGIGYHPNGMFRTATHGNGVITTFNADPNLMARPSSITAKYGTTTYWDSGAYAYDGAGNIKSIGTNTYKYDSLSRVLEGTVGANKQVYTYDPYGNMTRMMTYLNGVLNVDNTMNVSTVTNRLPASGGSIFGTYDSAGNQLTKNTGYTYTYDAFNMMTSRVEPGRDLTFVYTADDERIWEFNYLLSRGDYSIRDLDHKVLRVIREDSFATPRWSWKEDYIHRGSTLLSQSSPTGIVHLHVDHLGTSRWISNASRGQVGLHAYYPFGIESTFQGQNTIERKFTSHERDTDFGGNVDYLDYMHARYYSPVMGRFLSVDPAMDAEKNIGEPQRWNRYAYVTSSPLKYVDPDGRERAQIWLDHDVRDLMNRQISRQEYWSRINARGAGVLGAAGLVGAVSYAPGALVALSPKLLEWGVRASPLITLLRNWGAGEAGLPNVAAYLRKAERVGAALSADPLHRAASFGDDAVSAAGKAFRIKGGDGTVRTLVQAPGEVNETKGVFEYILNRKGQVEHQRFIRCGVVSGQPNQKAGC